MKQKYTIAAAVLLGGMAGLACDCCPADACTTMDLPNCNHYGETVVGVRPNCECVLFGVIIEDDDPGGSGGGGSGGGRFSMSAKPGWAILSVDATLGSAQLTTLSDLYTAPVTSQPLKILEQVNGGGGIDFSFGTVDPSVVAISGQEELGLTVIWDGPASIRMRKPSGEKITIPLPPRAFFPIAMSDDCETRTLDGTMSQGPVALDFEASFDSPGCD